MRNLLFPALLRICLLLIGSMFPKDSGAETISGKVVYVSDGDTLLLRTAAGEKEWIRMAEIDAPEKDQPGGLEAKEALMRRVEGHIVQVDYRKRDGYGRLLGHIHQGGDNLNAEMVRVGHAWVYRRYLDSPTLLRYEKEANAHRIGIWAQQKPTPPWEWRKNRTWKPQQHMQER